MMKMSKKSFILISLFTGFLLLQGCASPIVKINNQDRSYIENLKIVKSYQMNAGWPTIHKPLGAITLGLADDWSIGQELMKKFKITDPSLALKYKFIRAMNKRKKSAQFRSVKASLTNKDLDIETFKKKHKSGVVLQVLPAMWQIWYYPFSWGKYLMRYSASARLIRLSDSKILWSAFCTANQDQGSDTAPSLDEITADNSKILKTWVQKSTSQCAKQLVNDFYSVAN